MSDRNSRVGGSGNPGRHTWDDLEGNHGLVQRDRFFTAASEDKRISSLQSNDTLPFPRETNQQRVDVFLGN